MLTGARLHDVGHGRRVVCSENIDLHTLLREQGVPVAITLQAIFCDPRRLEEDSRRGSAVRLVKGAFVGEHNYAFINKKDIDRNYAQLAEMLLSARPRRRRLSYLRDPRRRIIHHIRRVAQSNGWSREGLNSKCFTESGRCCSRKF